MWLYDRVGVQITWCVWQGVRGHCFGSGFSPTTVGSRIKFKSSDFYPIIILLALILIFNMF